MATWFQNLPIRRKLFVITLASSALALVLGSGGFFAWDIVQYRREVLRDLSLQARTISENSTAALTFGDHSAAGETLAVLRIHPYIETACMYSADGALFATYFRGRSGVCPTVPADRIDVEVDKAISVTPIVFEGNRRIGTLLVERGLQDIRDRLAVGGLILMTLFILATVAALAAAARMQRAIADPLLQLAETARDVTATDDYSGRVVPTSTDELGTVVTAFNRMLDRVQQRTDELSQANRLKDEFLATLSHELRTPLNAVLGWVRILRSTDATPATQARALEAIERNGRLQASLIEDLLEVSRIVSGKLHLQSVPTDLSAIVAAAADVVQPAASAKEIRLKIDIQARPAMTMGDADRLQQVLWNLLFNAVKFTPAGGEITVTLRRNGGWVVTVSDTGIGIDPSFLPHIFQPFRQADGSASREHGGLGLGMTIVRHFVELHGGTVTARSDGLGKGATFEVRLPSVLTPEHHAARRPVETQAVTPADPNLLAGISVLVVDDDEDTRALLAMALESCGAGVRTAGSAAEAMRRFDDAVPDVLVSDIGMAMEDGYELMRRIRTRPPLAGGRVPSIALTAYASPADRAAALGAGYDAHVAKPFQPFEVASLIQTLASSRSRVT
jgi:signal transduction histidine kinase/CheY-like chemotaxis protein